MRTKNRISAILLALTMLGAAGCSVDEGKETETNDEAPLNEIVESESTKETEESGVMEEKTPVVDPEIAALIENGMIDVVSNDGNFDLRYASYTVQSDDTWVYLISLNDRYTVYVTYEEDGELDKNVTLHILDREKAEFTYVIPLDTQYHPHMIYSTDSGWILYNYNYDEGDEFYKSAYSVEITDDWCEVDEVELPIGFRNERYIYSPDGKYAAYLILTDYNWNGGINLVNPDGTTEQIFTNEVIDLFSTEDNFRYRPMCFLDNTHLLLTVGHGDGYAPLAYYIYDVTTGETTECPMGKYHPKAYGDGMVYLSDHMAFNDAWAYDNIWMTEAKNLLDGITDDELTLIASRDENTDVFSIKELGYSDMTGGFWYSRSTAEVTEGPDRGKHYDRYIISTPDFSETAADIIYNDRLLGFEPYNDSVVFVEKKVVSPDESPAPLEIHSNDGGLNIKSVEIPLVSENAKYTTFTLNERYTLFVTGDNGENVHLYAVDIENAAIVYDCELDTELVPTQLSLTSDGFIIYNTKFDDATQKMQAVGAFFITLNEGKFTVKPTTAELYPKYSGAVTSPDGQYTAVRFTNENGAGGVMLGHPNGSTKTILEDTDPDSDYSISEFSVYSPRGFIDDTHLLYYIGGWEWINGCGIYDVATGEKTEFLGLKYAPEGTVDGAFYVKELTKGGEYMYIPTAIRKITLDGTETLKASTDPSDGVFLMEEGRFFTWMNGLWYSYDVNEIPTDPNYLNTIDGSRVTIKLYSPDFDKTLAEIEYPTGSYMGICGDSVTVVIPAYAG